MKGSDKQSAEQGDGQSLRTAESPHQTHLNEYFIDGEGIHQSGSSRVYYSPNDLHIDHSLASGYQLDPPSPSNINIKFDAQTLKMLDDSFSHSRHEDVNENETKETRIQAVSDWLEGIDDEITDFEAAVRDLQIPCIDENLNPQEMNIEYPSEQGLSKAVPGYPAIPDEMTLYPIVKQVLQSFQHLQDQLTAIQNLASRISLADIEDETARFKIWGGAIGGLQSPERRSSLDYRLRDASQMRENILRVLQSLNESLQEAASICSGKREDEKWFVESQPSMEDESGTLSLSSFGNSNIDLSDQEAPSNAIETSESEQLFAAIKEAITNLFKFSVIIHSSSSSDFFGKSALKLKYDSAYDSNHIREKFPKAYASSPWLVKRLGDAMTARRQFLRYRSEHRSKLAVDFSRENDNNNLIYPAKSVAETKATTFVPPKDGWEAESTGSLTTYATQETEEEDTNRIPIPPMPEEIRDGIIECPYCCTFQYIKDRRVWKKHVLENLQPYICTFEDCTLKIFPSRSSWFDHELQNHRANWVCNTETCSRALFKTKALFKQHLEESHQNAYPKSQLSAVILQSQEITSKSYSSVCPLCDLKEGLLQGHSSDQTAAGSEASEKRRFNNAKGFSRHLGRHMEQLALFALPKHFENENIEAANSAKAVPDATQGNLSDLSSLESFNIQENPDGIITNYLTSLWDSAYDNIPDIVERYTRG